MGSSQSIIKAGNIPNELKCIYCGELLTCLPITIYQNKGNVCGRCPENAFDGGFRNVSFEALIKLQELPCRYKKNGCLTILNYEQVKRHEDSCYYRQYPCPTFSTQCSWKGKRSELKRHYECHHRAFMLEEGHFLSFSLQSAFEENIFVFSRKQFLVQLRYDNELSSLKCGLIYFEAPDEGKNYTFQITLKSGDDSITRTITKSSVANVFVKAELQEIDLRQIDFIRNSKGLYYTVKIFEVIEDN